MVEWHVSKQERQMLSHSKCPNVNRTSLIRALAAHLWRKEGRSTSSWTYCVWLKPSPQKLIHSDSCMSGVYVGIIRGSGHQCVCVYIYIYILHLEVTPETVAKLKTDNESDAARRRWKLLCKLVYLNSLAMKMMALYPFFNQTNKPTRRRPYLCTYKFIQFSGSSSGHSFRRVQGWPLCGEG